MATNKSKKFYAKGWDKWDDMKTYGPMSRHVRRLISKLLPPSEHIKSIADVGCGVGTLLRQLKTIYPHASLTGTELQRESLEVAQQRLPETQFYAHDITTSPLKTKADLVLSIDVLEHIEADEAALKHLAQSCNKYLLLVVPLGPLFEIEVERVGHVHGYSRQEFDSKIQGAGLQIINSIQWGFPFYNLYRRLLHHLPEAQVAGRYHWRKRLISQLVYLLLYLNFTSPWGERYFVLARVNS